MSLFGPKEPCPHCGRKVSKPKDPAEFLCPHCGQPGPWATEDDIARWRARTEARARYQELLEGITLAALPAGGDDSSLVAVREAAAYSSEELRSINMAAFRPVAQAAVADDIMTPEESAHLKGAMAALGITWADVGQVDPGLLDRAAVSEINGGQIPEVSSPHILPKKARSCITNVRRLS